MTTFVQTIHDSFFAYAATHPWIVLILVIVILFAGAAIVTPIIFSLLGVVTRATKTNIDDKIFEIAKPPVFWTLIFSSLALLVRVKLFALPVPSLLSSLALSFLVVVWVRPFVRASSVLLAAASKKRRSFVTSASLPLFQNITFIIVWSLAIYFLFSLWGISLTAWLASAGIIGIAVGFAAKDTLANLIAGIFILTDAPYKVGDIIALDSGERGTVVMVGVRSTRLRTFDGVEITIPNALMGNSRIVNETGTHIDKKLRVRVPVGVGYDTDIPQAEKILLSIAAEFEDICTEPEPQVKLVAFGASSLDLELRFWVPEPSKRTVRDKVNRRILEEFRKVQIEIPYQKIDVTLIK